MAVLSDAKRWEARAEFMEAMSSRKETYANLLKPDFKAAIDAADQWVEDNKGAYNSALPVAARTALTAAQKSELLVYVVRKRFQEGS